VQEQPALLTPPNLRLYFGEGPSLIINLSPKALTLTGKMRCRNDVKRSAV
jgi:hypothetical protein